MCVLYYLKSAQESRNYVLLLQIFFSQIAEVKFWKWLKPNDFSKEILNIFWLKLYWRVSKYLLTGSSMLWNVTASLQWSPTQKKKEKKEKLPAFLSFLPFNRGINLHSCLTRLILPRCVWLYYSLIIHVQLTQAVRFCHFSWKFVQLRNLFIV